MKFIGNILWLLLGGVLISFYYAVVGLLFCLTIIGIPFGLQLFKMAGVALWPFGHNIIPGANDTGCLSILMDYLRWHRNRHSARVVRHHILHHHHRHPVRPAALQDGPSGTGPVRQTDIVRLPALLVTFSKSVE